MKRDQDALRMAKSGYDAYWVGLVREPTPWSKLSDEHHERWLRVVKSVMTEAARLRREKEPVTQ